MTNIYPNSPVNKPKQVERKEDREYKLAIKERPILGLLDEYFAELIARTDSIKGLGVTKDTPEAEIKVQFLVQTILEQKLTVIHNEIKRRIKATKAKG